MTIDPADAYQRAAALFGETITALSDDEWEAATGDEWTVVTTSGDDSVVGDAGSIVYADAKSAFSRASLIRVLLTRSPSIAKVGVDPASNP